MRRVLIALSLLGLAGGAAAAVQSSRSREGASAAPAGVLPASIVECGQAIELDSAPSPPADYRVLFERVAVSGEKYQGDPVREEGPLPYWAKSGLLVASGHDRVELVVPNRWRDRVAIGWGGSGLASRLDVRPCNAARWTAWAGGFHLRDPACIPLIVRVGAHTADVRIGIGSRCGAG